MLTHLQPVTEVKRHATELIEEIQQTKEPLLITQHGRAAAVLMDVESYEAMQRRMEILLALARGRQDAAEGRVKKWSEVKSRLAKKHRHV